MKRGRVDAGRATSGPAEGSSASDADPRVAAFLRGVTIGALVGAAIAGSALWERAMRRRAAADGAGEGVDPPPG